MSIRQHVDDLNQMILNGQILEAFDKYYAHDCVMQDGNQDPRVGKETNRSFEEMFVSGLTEFRGAELKASAVNEETGVAMNEWFFDYSHSDFGDQTYDQIAVQRWEDGKIVHERFYQVPHPESTEA